MQYPTYIQLVGSRIELDDGTQVDLSESGQVHIRILYSETLRTIILKHELETAATNEILDFYQANKKKVFEVLWQGDIPNTSYNCRFLEAPKYVPNDAGEYEVETTMVIV